MKPATDAAQSGEIVETTTRRRVVPVNSESENKTPEFWSYVRTIPQAEWAKHMIYLYRIEPKPSVPLTRTGNSYLTLPNGQQVALADQEEVEFALAQHFGGGVFRFIAKKGAQWVTQERVEINAPVRTNLIPVTDQGATGAPTITGQDGMTQVANKAIDTIAGQEHQAVRIGIDALGAAANIVRTFGEGRPAASDSETNHLIREMLAEMRAHRSGMSLTEILGAASAIVGIFKELGILGGNASPMMSQVLDVAMKRLLEPPVSGNPVNTGAALVQMLPTIGSQFVDGLREFAKVRENEARILAMQRGQQPPPANPQVIPPAIAATGQPANQPQNGAPSMEFVDRKIIEIFQQPISAEQAADEAMDFLEKLQPGTNAQLAALGEDGLLRFFSTRPILSVATANPTRLTEFIRAFLKMHAEDQAAENAQPAAKPPLPN